MLALVAAIVVLGLVAGAIVIASNGSRSTATGVDTGSNSGSEAKRFENATVHQAKFRFDALYDQLLATVRGGPSPEPTNSLF